MAEGGSKNMNSHNAKPIVEVTDLRLSYRRSRYRTTSLKETVIAAIRQKITYEDFFALDGVTLDLRIGETLAVIGRNGAGKSTLLKTLARVLPPTSGKVVVRGLVAPMIELGAGFNPELTGAENIVLYGTLLGRDAKMMKSRIKDIADWAQLTEHLDIPIRSYSTGMIARLAFAIATDVTPNLLLIDEVLSVGDQEFQHKSKLRMREMMESGCGVILVTHDLAAVEAIADRAAYLENGRIEFIGNPKKAVEFYLSRVNKTSSQGI
jgi:ABC-type polysaccharide/polyol phosphate transport system ATPase subunit